MCILNKSGTKVPGYPQRENAVIHKKTPEKPLIH